MRQRLEARCKATILKRACRPTRRGASEAYDLQAAAFAAREASHAAREAELLARLEVRERVIAGLTAHLTALAARRRDEPRRPCPRTACPPHARSAAPCSPADDLPLAPTRGHDCPHSFGCDGHRHEAPSRPTHVSPPLHPASSADSRPESRNFDARPLLNRVLLFVSFNRRSDVFYPGQSKPGFDRRRPRPCRAHKPIAVQRATAMTMRSPRSILGNARGWSSRLVGTCSRLEWPGWQA